MTQKKLIVKISSIEESLARLQESWALAEKAYKSPEPTEVLSFENPATLIKTLSPKRLELLQVLHSLGHSSIRKLAKELERDYSNVHHDVQALKEIGVIIEKEGQYSVPWDSIVTEISFGKKPTSTKPIHGKRSAA